MKAVLLNTYLHGGAGIASQRLQHALSEKGVEASMLSSADLLHKVPFYLERLTFLPFERDATVRFSFSPANFGHNLTKHALVQDADILHLHWINQGFISISGIQALSRLNKPLVWTLHDMWPFTGGCHYSGECARFQAGCGHCKFLKNPSATDLSNQVVSKKRRSWPMSIRWVTCSAWLKSVASSSYLIGDARIDVIPNPIDTKVFAPLPPESIMSFKLRIGVSADTKLLLFVAMKISDERKGFSYLKLALEHLSVRHPELNLNIVVLGKAESSDFVTLPYRVHLLGLQTDASSLIEVYGSADVFVIPSLEDNLPNTIVESLSCGTPVVGFGTGGIPEMLAHQEVATIARARDSFALSEGIFHVLSKTTGETKSHRMKNREIALATYSESVVAKQYIRLYEEALNE
jgi:glycosyltransferase involved in cell wall biosynthesis